MFSPASHMLCGCCAMLATKPSRALANSSEADAPALFCPRLSSIWRQKHTAMSQTYRGQWNGILFSCTYFMGRCGSTQDYNREKGKCSEPAEFKASSLLMCKSRVCVVLTCDNDPCFACTARSIRWASAYRRTTANTVGTATDDFTFFVNPSDDVVPLLCIDKKM